MQFFQSTNLLSFVSVQLKHARNADFQVPGIMLLNHVPLEAARKGDSPEGLKNHSWTNKSDEVNTQGGNRPFYCWAILHGSLGSRPLMEAEPLPHFPPTMKKTKTSLWIVCPDKDPLNICCLSCLCLFRPHLLSPSLMTVSSILFMIHLKFSKKKKKPFQIPILLGKLF